MHFSPDPKDSSLLEDPSVRFHTVPRLPFSDSYALVNENAMAPTVRGEQDYLYKSESGKSSPSEILDAIAAFNAEGRPIWKPMHMQPIYRTNAFVTIEGTGVDVGADIFRRGLCLPSDNKMTVEQQNIVIDIIHRCFR